MKRRDVLTALGISVGSIAGCVSSSSGNRTTTDDQPPGYIPPVTVTAEDATPSGTVGSLDVRWNARAQFGISTNDSFFVTVAGDDEKFLVFRLILTNAGDRAISLSPVMFRVLIDGTLYEYESWETQRNLEGVTLDPGGSLDGWLAYRIPRSPTEARYVVRQTATPSPISVQFTHDEDLELDALRRDNPQDP